GWIEELTRVCLEHGLCRRESKRKITIKATPAAARAMLAQWCAERGIEPERTDTDDESVGEDALRHAGIPGLDDVLERGPSTPETARELLVGGRFVGHPLDAYRRRGSLQRELSGRVEALERPVVRWRYRELVDSGRTSCVKPNRKTAAKTPWRDWCGIQAQNQPREGGFRECLVPDPGCMFLITDISAAELAALAAVHRV